MLAHGLRHTRGLEPGALEIAERALEPLVVAVGGKTQRAY